MLIPPLRKILVSPISLIYGFLFLAFFVPGAWLGMTILIGKDNGPVDSNNHEDPVRSGGGNQQKNLMFISVDSFSPHTSRLRGVWLAVYIPDRPDVSLIPIYPLYAETDALADQRILRSFALDAAGIPDNEFFDELKKSIWWDHYLIVDDYALSQWIDFIGGVSVEGSPLDGYEAIKSVPVPPIDLEESLAGQVNLLGTICQRISIHPAPENFSTYLSGLADHMRTDTTVEDFLGPLLVSKTSDGPKINCEFPTLNITKP
jgi:hypothetical protein